MYIRCTVHRWCSTNLCNVHVNDTKCLRRQILGQIFNLVESIVAQEWTLTDTLPDPNQKNILLSNTI